MIVWSIAPWIPIVLGCLGLGLGIFVLVRRADVSARLFPFLMIIAAFLVVGAAGLSFFVPTKTVVTHLSSGGMDESSEE